MTTRYCPRCRAEVEDTGGFCLLGHPLRLAAPVDSLSHLRAEVNAAFAEAEAKVALAVGGAHVGSLSATQHEVAPPPPPPRNSRPDPFAGLTHTPSGPDPMADFAPPPRMDWGPKPSFWRRRRNA